MTHGFNRQIRNRRHETETKLGQVIITLSCQLALAIAANLSLLLRAKPIHETYLCLPLSALTLFGEKAKTTTSEMRMVFFRIFLFPSTFSDEILQNAHK